jgi:pimeloyl-ACP methyl ester carboxylesterase
MERGMSYRTFDVDVRGGTLRVGEWNGDDPSRPVVVAAHGITASHLAWAALADAMPEVCIVAPDLRGRGRSNALPGPFGMAQHADDLAAVSRALELDPVLVIGHSMGAFVALVTAHRHPDLFRGPFLIDGGLPLALPQGVDTKELLTTSLGPAAKRLSMTFADRAAYLEFWRGHPAFVGHWDDRLVDYLAYDLVGTEPELRPAASFEAVAADSAGLYGGTDVESALAALDHPISLLVAPRGLMDETPGLYTIETISHWRTKLPFVETVEVPDVNHYTIVMSPAGAATVADAVRVAMT